MASITIKKFNEKFKMVNFIKCFGLTKAAADTVELF